MDYYYQTSAPRTYQEMRQKPAPQNTFFNLKSEPQGFRPVSVATEFVDTDWDEDIISEAEDNSPRASLQSSGQPSLATLSTYDEVPTPRTSRHAYIVEQTPKEIAGPRGPHLFNPSADPSLYEEEEVVLTLSPITPKAPRNIDDLVLHSHQPPVPRRNSPFSYTKATLDTTTLVSWTPEMVAQSMLNAGIEQTMADRFIENDINGAILVTLKFEDLRELDIASFGIRTRVWHQIQALRDIRPASPRAPTPIEDVPDKEVRREVRRDSPGLKRKNSEKRPKKKPSATDTIMPGESVSIIGIEQVIPKPHHCSKGENCSKYRKQMRLIEKFKKLNPNVDLNTSAGAVLVYGDAGNPETAKAIDPNDAMRPMSDAEPSVVASSDVLGTGGIPALQYLQEASIRNAQAREAQANVRQFLQFQQNNINEVPPTPPFEMGASKPAHQGLRHLPRLSIPGTTTSQGTRMSPPRAATVPPPTQQPQQAQQYYNQQNWQQQQQQQQPIYDSPEREEFVPYQMERADPRSPDLETQRNPYRFGTPFSEMDVPVTSVNLGPVARDNSQSVPPDMNYHHAVINPQPPRQRATSRASGRRPSFPVMPVLSEERATGRSKTPSPQVHSPPSQVYSPPRAPVSSQQPLRAPPRVAYPWSPVERTNFEHAIPPASSRMNNDGSSASSSNFPPGVSFQGPMKKRKQKILRHEWQDGFFTIKGTRLNMHKDAQEIDRTLEYIDIDDYAIACSSVASQSKLSAAFKAVSISHDRKRSDPVGAFQFQLVPQDKNGARLRKRDSAAPPKDAPPQAVNGTGKTHHFAVKNRDDRIDWMRELMLAKALKQKGEGFEISVNGSMI